MKTPSQQKGYELYLKHYVEKPFVKRLSTKKGHSVIALKDLLQKRDRLEKRRAKSRTAVLSRVRRNPLHIPKDFKEVENSTDSDKQSGMSSNTNNEKSKMSDHLEELEKLKCLIWIKRDSNRKLKNLKKLKASQLDPLLIAEGTKSLSGRVRKINNRYRGDFATNTFQLDMLCLQEKTNAKLAQLNKKRVLNKHLKSKIKSRLSKSAAKSNVKRGDIKPDGLPGLHDEDEEFQIFLEGENTCEEFKPENLSKSNCRPVSHKRKRDKLKTSNSQAKKLKSNGGTCSEIPETKAKKKTANNNHVLIQEMPNEIIVMHKLLQDDKTSEHENYSNIKSLLKKSQSQSSSIASVKSEGVDVLKEQEAQQGSNFEVSDEDSAYKYQKFKIPKNVQNLFNKTSQSSIVVPSTSSATHQRQSIVLHPVTTSSVLAGTTGQIPASTNMAPAVSVLQSVKSTYAAITIPTTSPSSLSQTLRTVNNQYKIISSGKNQLIVPLNVGKSLIPRTVTPSQSSSVVSFPVVFNPPYPNLVNSGIRPVLAQALPRTSNQTPLAKPASVLVPSSTVVSTVAPVSTISSSKQTQVVHVPFTQRSQTSVPKPSVPKPTISTSTVHEKGKFYLIKIDGKNILIPMEGSPQLPPKAYVVNTSVPLSSPNTSRSTTNSLTGSTMTFTVRANQGQSKIANSVAVSSEVGQQTQPIIQTIAPIPAVLKQPINSGQPLISTSPRVVPKVQSTPMTSLLTESQIKKEVIDPSEEILYSSTQQTVLPGSESDKGDKRPLCFTSDSQNKLIHVRTIYEKHHAGGEVQGLSETVSKAGEAVPSKLTEKEKLSEPSGKKADKYEISKNKEIKDSENNEKAGKKEETKPVAFSEAVTAREERLRKLKEMLKQQQQAVEELRIRKSTSSS